MKKMDKKAFTLIELIVVVAVVGILVLLGMPRFIGHKDKAELARIQHDVKVMEQEIGTVLINNDDDFNNWEDNSKDFNQLIQENRLFEKEGIAEKVESIDKVYKVIPEKYKDNINTKLKGTFYANDDGKVYYEHEKPLLGIPIKPEEKESEYSDEEIDDLVKIDYIPVATAEELNSIRINEERTYGKGTQWEDKYTGGLDKKYVQVANLDLSGYDGWSPIGAYDLGNYAPFTGTYDGGNYVIRGLEVKGEDENQGLFGMTDGAIIRNVGLIDNKVTGSGDNLGGLVGNAYDSTIENSYATGSVEGTDNLGGLVGYAHSITIENSYSTGSITGDEFTGGLVGNAYESSIKDSYATGSVTGTDNVGGLVGYAINNSTISNSYATGSVTGSGDYVGGLVGSATRGTKIRNSYATGSIEGKRNIGGLVGWTRDSIIENSYATDSVQGSEDNIGGLVGGTDNSTIENSYAKGSVTGGSYVGGLVGSAGSSSTISNSYAIGSVEGDKLVGGFVGFARENIIENSYATGSVTGTEYVAGLVGQADNNTISNSYATGKVTGSGFGAGGLVGWARDSNISNSYWDTKTTGQEESHSGGAGMSTEDMKLKGTYEGWDFEETWKIDEGKDYPKLR